MRLQRTRVYSNPFQPCVPVSFKKPSELFGFISYSNSVQYFQFNLRGVLVFVKCNDFVRMND